MKVFLLFLLCASACSSVLRAQEISGFQTLSGNILCSLYDDPSLDATVLDCGLKEIGNSEPPLPMPADCDADWGYRFAVKRTGKPFMVCAGDSLADPKHTVLQYGETYNDADIGCHGSTKGLECTNADGQGFFISKSKQRFF